VSSPPAPEAIPVAVGALVVEDDPQIRTTLTITLRAAGYAVTAARNAAEALALARRHRPDLVVLDLGLPDRDGLHVIRQLRSWSDVPIVVLSGRTGSGDKVTALDAGADDYVTKPFATPELLARLRAARRRADPGERTGETYVGPVHVDFTTRTLDRADGGTDGVQLTPTEWDLMELLARNPGRLMTHAELATRIWGADTARAAQSLRTYMARLRHKLEPDPTRPRHLLTEPGMGYRFQPGPSTRAAGPGAQAEP